MKLINNVKTIAVSMALVGSFAVGAAEYHGTDNAVSTNLCVVAAEGKKLKLVKMAKSYRIKMQDVANKIDCNDMDIATFADQQGAKNVATLLRRYQGELSYNLTAKN